MPTLLVVDDDDAVRDLTRQVLESAGYEVVQARDGAEAVALVSQRADIALALADVWLPDIAGDLLIRFLREQRPHLKALLMTGYPQDILERRGVKVEVPVLYKPHQPRELLRAIEVSLER